MDEIQLSTGYYCCARYAIDLSSLRRWPVVGKLCTDTVEDSACPYIAEKHEYLYCDRAVDLRGYHNAPFVRSAPPLSYLHNHPPPHSAMAVPRRYRVGVRVTSALTALLVVFLYGYWTRSGLSHSTPRRDHPLDTASLTNDHHPNLHHRHLMSYHGDSNGSHGDNSSYKCESPLHPPPSYHGDSCQFVRDHCSGEAQLINYLAFITCNMKDVKVCFVFDMWYPIFCLPFCLSACLSVCPVCLSPTLSLSLSFSLCLLPSFLPLSDHLTTSLSSSSPAPGICHTGSVADIPHFPTGHYCKLASTSYCDVCLL